MRRVVVVQLVVPELEGRVLALEGLEPRQRVLVAAVEEQAERLVAIHVRDGGDEWRCHCGFFLFGSGRFIKKGRRNGAVLFYYQPRAIQQYVPEGRVGAEPWMPRHRHREPSQPGALAPEALDAADAGVGAIGVDESGDEKAAIERCCIEMYEKPDRHHINVYCRCPMQFEKAACAGVAFYYS